MQLNAEAVQPALFFPFLGRSEATITKFAQEYDDVPVRRDNGKGYVASRTELNMWFRAYLRGEK